MAAEEETTEATATQAVKAIQEIPETTAVTETAAITGTVATKGMQGGMAPLGTAERQAAQETTGTAEETGHRVATARDVAERMRMRGGAIPTPLDVHQIKGTPRIPGSRRAKALPPVRTIQTVKGRHLIRERRQAQRLATLPELASRHPR